ncbi:MAG: diguanylate cyclase, partial [Pseudomonadota bacterium]
MLSGLLSKLRVRAEADPRDEEAAARVHRVLVETLYTQPSSLAFGAVAGVVSTGVVACVSDIRPLTYVFLTLTLIAAARIALAYAVSPGKNTSSATALEVAYEFGAFSYALLLGSAAALTIWFDATSEVRMMMVANALCYGVGVCARNAGRPTIAMGQLALVSLPIAVVSATLGTVVSTIFAVTILFLIAGMTSIAANIGQALRESVSNAEESAQLAEKMQALARTDVVTGLANRAGLNHAMVETMMTIGKDEKLALFWIDLDRFKEVNDLLGH